MASQDLEDIEHDRRPESACIICDPVARAAMPPGAQAYTVELLEYTPADRIPGVPCWNCAGFGKIGGPNWKHRYLDELQRLMLLWREHKWACADCGNRQATDIPEGSAIASCTKCKSVRVVLISVLVETVGPDWAQNFK